MSVVIDVSVVLVLADLAVVGQWYSLEPSFASASTARSGGVSPFTGSLLSPSSPFIPEVALTAAPEE